jgi:hypothetical protein
MMGIRGLKGEEAFFLPFLTARESIEMNMKERKSSMKLVP